MKPLSKALPLILFASFFTLILLLTLSHLTPQKAPPRAPSEPAREIFQALPTTADLHQTETPNHSAAALPENSLVTLPAQNNRALLTKAKLRSPKLPFRFASPVKTNLTTLNSGHWQNDETWFLELHSPGAQNLSLALIPFNLPPGATLTLADPNQPEGTHTFTAADNETHRQLWTPLLESSRILLKLEIPLQLRPQLQLGIAQVNHGFRSAFHKNLLKIGGDTSGSCNIDVTCTDSQYPFASLVQFYQDQIRSVGAYTINGIDTCTGALINNTANDRRPFFLTADHCNVSTTNAPSMVVYWNFQNSTCRPPDTSSSGSVGDGPLTTFNSGAIFRSANNASDFCLVELDDPVNPAANAFFAGWNRSTNTPSSTTAIHHPAVAEKRISFDLDAPTVTNYSSNTVVTNGTHFRIIDWDFGTTEGGSSGSPLFDQNGFIIGQLEGGTAACGNNFSDWYGRLSTSWIGGGSQATQLSSWLDPLNTSPSTLDGTNNIPLLAILPSSLNEGTNSNSVLNTTITLSEASTETVSVSLQLSGTADSSDYTLLTSLPLTFQPGQTSLPLSFEITGDSTPEENESIILTLTNPQNALASPDPITLLILNDDFITPEITGPLTATISEGESLSLPITALNTPTSFSISNNPTGLEVDTNTGILTWNNPLQGNYSITLFAQNSAGTDQETLTLNVLPDDLIQALDLPSSFPIQNSTLGFRNRTTTTFFDNDAAESDDLNDSQTASFTLTLPGPDSARFYWKVSSEEGFDTLNVAVNGSLINSVSGEVDWTLVRIDLPQSSNQVIFSYVKDFSISQGSDTAWIDRLQITSLTQVPLLTSSNIPPAFQNQEFFYQFFTHLPTTSISINGLTPELSFDPQTRRITSQNLTSPANLTLTLTNDSGSNTEFVTIEPIASQPNLASALDQPNISATIPDGTNWLTSSSPSSNGGSSACSPSLQNNEQSSLQVLALGPGKIQFDWLVSSEENFDFLTFYLNGNAQQNISGVQTDFSTVTADLLPGINQLRWTYSKDSSAFSGQDRGFIDNLRLYGYSAWVIENNIFDLAALPSISSDNDPNIHLLEYALDLDPALSELAALPTLDFTNPNQLTVTVDRNPNAIGVDVTPVASLNLLDPWNTSLFDQINRQSSQTTGSISNLPPSAFFRIEVEAIDFNIPAP
ncbi:MAG: trypsin-like serine protease [Verrucomicrobiota bacterium]